MSKNWGQSVSSQQPAKVWALSVSHKEINPVNSLAEFEADSHPLEPPDEFLDCSLMK